MDDMLVRLAPMMVVLQSLIGMMILLGSVLLLALGTDKKTKACIRLPIVGLLAWSAWYVYLAFNGHHDSPPGLAFAALVAWVLLRHGRQIRGIFDGETWWPKNKGGAQ